MLKYQVKGLDPTIVFCLNEKDDSPSTSVTLSSYYMPQTNQPLLKHNHFFRVSVVKITILIACQKSVGNQFQ